ncbi:acyl-CoA/acyl-ACP dehydrogenase [Xanthobacter dioxanivorans]|uniref:Acyl-CoA/acyl-ACP dehydrogenase n=1 Tax=Xanthobacter dioxanivorans TaxID=2528964 RepID=A0A974PSA3_9HYPH|nr:acyl-CoA dehydrogenase family protein [Xanthobacter dioxanivorans]QRG08877.1 acyl-CoA/acyl-ACP dehydrogenase [Xanthobacter dioxanivorans]
MNLEEPEHIAMIRDTVRRFVETEMPRDQARRWDKENHFPRHVFDRLAGLGMMGLTVDEEYGGAGRDIPACMVVIEELSRRSMAVAVPYIMCACYAGMNLAECASPEQKAELLPKVAAGQLLFAYGWSEPDVGADLASVRTSAVRDGDAVIISGAKRFCSGAALSDYIFTLVRTGPANERYHNLSLILVPPNAPGVSITQIDCMGMKGAGTTDVLLCDVRVPLANVIGGAAGWNRGWDFIVGSGLDVEKLEVAAMALGIAAAAYDDSWNYVQERAQFGRRICSNQSVRHLLADMRTALHGSRLMMAHASQLAQDNKTCRLETAMTKLHVCEVGRRVALDAQTIFGAYGYAKEYDVERYVRESLLMPIIGGSAAIQRNNIVNWMGLPKA